MFKPRRAVLALVISCLLLVPAGCATDTPGASQSVSASPAPPGYLVHMTHVTLRPEHPAHVTFHLASAGVRVTVAAGEPLLSYALERVTPLPSSLPVSGGVVALSGAGHTAGGQTVYALRNANPLVAGWYRLELVGRGELIRLSIEGR